MRTLADLSGKRANAARGAVSHAERAEIENRAKPPERRISPELEPGTFDGRVGLEKDDESDEVLMRARRAYAVHRDKLAKWHEREKTIYGNQYERPEKLRMLTSKMVRDELDKGLDLPTSAHHDLRREIETIDKRMDAAFRNRLKIDEAREVRQHCKSLSKGDRRKLLATADPDVVASVLAAKPFLSGLTDAEAAMLRHQTVTAWFPEELRRREKLERAQQLLTAAGELYFKGALAMVSKDLKEFEAQQAAMQAAAAGTA